MVADVSNSFHEKFTNFQNAAGGEVSMHPRPLNEKGGNDSMCASIGQQTKEQTTHWSKLQAIRERKSPDVVVPANYTPHPKMHRAVSEKKERMFVPMQSQPPNYFLM